MCSLENIKVKRFTQCLWLILSIVAIQRYYQFFTTGYLDYEWNNLDEKERTEVAEKIFVDSIKLRSIAISNSTMFMQYLDYVSSSTLNKICQSFGIPNLTSTTLQRKFLSCTGLEIYKHYLDYEGNIRLPKQFHNCKKMSFQNSGNTTMLVSWLGSGNLWVRQLLETTTGIYTGSDQDCDVSHIIAGMFGEGIASENVIAVAAHHTAWNIPHNSRVVYIIRNPLDIITTKTFGK